MQCRLPVHILRELQDPIKMKSEDINRELTKLLLNFPRYIIPMKKLNIQKEKQKQEK